MRRSSKKIPVSSFVVRAATVSSQRSRPATAVARNLTLEGFFWLASRLIRSEYGAAGSMAGTDFGASVAAYLPALARVPQIETRGRSNQTSRCRQRSLSGRDGQAEICDSLRECLLDQNGSGQQPGQPSLIHSQQSPSSCAGHLSGRGHTPSLTNQALNLQQKKSKFIA